MEEDKKLSGNLTETVLMDKNDNIKINNKQNTTEEDFNGNVTEIVVHKCIFEVRGVTKWYTQKSEKKILKMIS
jgi:hypothetical protein